MMGASGSGPIDAVAQGALFSARKVFGPQDINASDGFVITTREPDGSDHPHLLELSLPVPPPLGETIEGVEVTFMPPGTTFQPWESAPAGAVATGLSSRMRPGGEVAPQANAPVTAQTPVVQDPVTPQPLPPEPAPQQTAATVQPDEAMRQVAESYRQAYEQERSSKRSYQIALGVTVAAVGVDYLWRMIAASKSKKHASANARKSGSARSKKG